MQSPHLYKSATFRFMAISSLVILFAISLVLTLQYRALNNAIEQQFRSTINADLDGFAAFYEQRRIVALRQALEYRSAPEINDGAIYLLQDRNGQKLAGNLKTWPNNAIPTQDQFEQHNTQRLNINATTYDVVARELPGGFNMLVGRDRSAINAAVANNFKRIIMFGSALFLAWIALAWYFINFILKRINRVNQVAARVEKGDMLARLSTDEKTDEFSTLHQHINSMLDRINTLHRSKLRISDAIAHELRTPLNRIHQRIDDLKGGGEQKQTIQDEITRTIRIFDSLLDISSAEAQQGHQEGMVPVNFSNLATEIFDLYEPLTEEKKLGYLAEVQPDLHILGAPSLLAQLISNLLDNAIKFTNDGDKIVLRVKSRDNFVILQVSDTGPGLPEDIKTDAFEKFIRSERDRAIVGHGLGLALVHAIAIRHGAKLQILDTNNSFAIETSWAIFEPIDFESQG